MPKGCDVVHATSVKTGRIVKLKFTVEDVLGVGTFGTVYRAKTEDGKVFAFKEQQLSPRNKFREITMSLHMSHPNLVKLHYYKVKRHKYCLTFMDYMPTSLTQLIRKYSKREHEIPRLKRNVYMFQLLKGLAFMHRRDIAHRDIKSDNIVVNDETAELKICDFGSAKIINDGSKNQSYICSRWYRAPELLMGSEKYTVNVDLWSAGCILLELILLEVCFEGKDSIDQLAKYSARLGPPSPDDLDAIEPKLDVSYLEEPLSCDDDVERVTPRSVGGTDTYKFVLRLLQYNPENRIPAWDALFHRYFAHLRSTPRFEDGKKLPGLLNWTREEKKLVPKRERSREQF